MRFKNNKMKLQINVAQIKELNHVMTSLHMMTKQLKQVGIGPIPVIYDGYQFATIYIVDGEVTIEFKVS